MYLFIYLFFCCITQPINPLIELKLNEEAHATKLCRKNPTEIENIFFRPTKLNSRC